MTKRIRDLLDLKIFIHCDSDISLCRRVIRDIQERGRDAKEVLTRYNRFVREDFNNFVKPSMKYADVVLPGGANNSSISANNYSRFWHHTGQLEEPPEEHQDETKSRFGGKPHRADCGQRGQDPNSVLSGHKV